MSSINSLLQTVPERPEQVLQALIAHPELATAQDESGYSLLHAAVSYGHADLARQLVNVYKVDVNIRDVDGDVPLGAAETVEIARLLVEELHADISIRNDEGATVYEKIEGEEDFPLVSNYLREAASASLSNGLHPPPRLPPGVGNVRIGTTTEAEQDQSSPDPELRRRIEELASRSDFQSESGQADLRDLVREVVTGIREDQTQERATRRRTD